MIIVAGNGRDVVAEALFRVLKNSHRVRKMNVISLLSRGIMIISPDFKNISRSYLELLKMITEKAAEPIIVVTRIGDPIPNEDIFAGEISEAGFLPELIKSFPGRGHLIYNADDEVCLEIKNNSVAREKSFGFGEDSHLRATDILITKTPELGTNFKINYGGHIIPVWLKGLFGKENIYAALAASATGLVSGMNLVEASQSLNDFTGMHGQMRVVAGIKNTLILDGSACASASSMAEALEILGKIEALRKIAVLGDILNIGKYSIEAHESIGERAAQIADLLFTIGAHAKFIAEEAGNKGLARDKIKSFEDAVTAGLAIREALLEGDLVLIKGSAEMQMDKIVEEIIAE